MIIVSDFHNTVVRLHLDPRWLQQMEARIVRSLDKDMALLGSIRTCGSEAVVARQTGQSRDADH